MNYFIYCMLVFTSMIICSCSFTTESLEKTFDKGVKAYSDERWSRCIDKFEEALHFYKFYKSVVINCRLKCNAQVYERQVKEDIDDLKMYETYFNKRNCIKKCQKNGFLGLNLKMNPDEYVLHKMHDKAPYEYLHMCYYQMHMFQKAASAAYTYFVAHPDHEIMQANLRYYTEMPEVEVNEIVDLEGDDYVVLHRLGKIAYNNDNWAETVANMEEALKDYIASENVCRVECEQQPGQEWSSEFVITLSNNIASLLHCRQECQDKLKLMKYKSGVEFLASVLNHLQMSYFHLEKLEDAAEAVATHLILVPNDEDMLQNEKFYSEVLKKPITSKRSDLVYYFKRDTYEKDLLHLFHKEEYKNKIDSNSI